MVGKTADSSRQGGGDEETGGNERALRWISS